MWVGERQLCCYTPLWEGARDDRSGNTRRLLLNGNDRKQTRIFPTSRLRARVEKYVTEALGLLGPSRGRLGVKSSERCMTFPLYVQHYNKYLKERGVGFIGRRKEKKKNERNATAAQAVADGMGVDTGGYGSVGVGRGKQSSRHWNTKHTHTYTRSSLSE